MIVTKAQNEKYYDSLITTEYIRTQLNKYRLSIEFFGAYNDESLEANPERSTGAEISLHEITGQNPETIAIIYDHIKDNFEDSCESEGYEVKKSAYFVDFTDYSHTIKYSGLIKEMLETIEG